MEKEKEKKKKKKHKKENKSKSKKKRKRMRRKEERTNFMKTSYFFNKADDNYIRTERLGVIVEFISPAILHAHKTVLKMLCFV